ncbi:MAG: cytochrome C oxidase subunit IV family protein [Tepidisphaeraceae bacterium]
MAHHADTNIAAPGTDPDHIHDKHHGHVVPLWLLTTVFAILMVLTFVTVAVTWKDFGYNVNLTIALVIAVIKGALVGLYFMHLRWDSPFNALAFVGSLVFVSLFIWLAILDTGQYRRNYDPPTGWQQDTSLPKGL